MQVGSKPKGSARGDRALSLVDIKEAFPASAPRARSARMPEHDGERVVTGARQLSPYLGERMIFGTLGERPVFVRELLPQDLKFELDTLDDRAAIAVAHRLAMIVGIAHARQIDPEDCAKWLAEVRQSHVKNLEAPSWLWKSVVDLVSAHEGAYLEHCREHGLHDPT